MQGDPCPGDGRRASCSPDPGNSCDDHVLVPTSFRIGPCPAPTATRTCPARKLAPTPNGVTGYLTEPAWSRATSSPTHWFTDPVAGRLRRRRPGRHRLHPGSTAPTPSGWQRKNAPRRGRRLRRDRPARVGDRRRPLRRARRAPVLDAISSDVRELGAAHLRRDGRSDAGLARSRYVQWRAPRGRPGRPPRHLRRPRRPAGVQLARHRIATAPHRRAGRAVPLPQRRHVPRRPGRARTCSSTATDSRTFFPGPRHHRPRRRRRARDLPVVQRREEPARAARARLRGDRHVESFGTSRTRSTRAWSPRLEAALPARSSPRSPASRFRHPDDVSIASALVHYYSLPAGARCPGRPCVTATRTSPAPTPPGDSTRSFGNAPRRSASTTSRAAHPTLAQSRGAIPRTRTSRSPPPGRNNASCYRLGGPGRAEAVTTRRVTRVGGCDGEGRTVSDACGANHRRRRPLAAGPSATRDGL